MLLEHKEYIARYGDDMPAVLEWRWGGGRRTRGRRADTAADNV
jgi:xylulose-5-phosphate/fructose-6-phosphate phosphoketolase